MLHLLFCLAMTGLSVQAEQPATPSEFSALLASYQRPTLGQSLPISNLSYSFGNLTVLFESGKASPLYHGEQNQGLFFEGKGTLIYQSNYPLEAASFRNNLKETLKIEPVSENGGLSITLPFDRMLLQGDGATLQEARPGEPEPQLGKALEKLLGQFSNVRSEVSAHQLTRHVLNKEQGPMVKAHFTSGEQRLIYSLDLALDKREQLTVLHGFTKHGQYRDLVETITLSDQPIGTKPGVYQLGAFLLTHLQYAVEVRGDRYQMTFQETVTPAQSGLRVLLFELWSDRKVDGTNYHHTVTSLKDSSGRALNFSHHNGSLAIELAEPTVAQQKTTFEIKIEGRHRQNPNEPMWQFGTAPWFPFPGLGNSYFTSAGTVKVNKPFVPISLGTTVRRFEEGDMACVESRLDQPAQFHIVQAGKYFLKTFQNEGLTIHVASYRKDSPKAAVRLNDTLYSLFQIYKKWLGPMPTPEFQIVQMPGVGFGQGPLGGMFIASDAFEEASLGSLRPWTYRMLAHEAAHQYWGGVVKMGSEEEQWVTEAFAEIMSGLVVQHFQSKGSYDAVLREWRTNSKKTAKDGNPITAARVFSEDAIERIYDRQRLMYHRGAHFLTLLRQEIGDEAFSQFLTLYMNKFTWKFSSSSEFEVLANALAGKDLKPLFDRELWLTAP